jgi:hypothetical protein
MPAAKAPINRDERRMLVKLLFLHYAAYFIIAHG